MILDILKFPARSCACGPAGWKPSTGETAELMQNMLETMYAAPGIGIGGAAGGRIHAHPRAGPRSREPRRQRHQAGQSGDLRGRGRGGLRGRLPQRRRLHRRGEPAERVAVSGYDENGEEVDIEADGLLAVALQHEIDHLDGKLFIDRISRLKREIYVRKLKSPSARARSRRRAAASSSESGQGMRRGRACCGALTAFGHPLPGGRGVGFASLLPLSLWERVGVRVSGVSSRLDGVKRWEGRIVGAPSPGLRPPSLKGRGFSYIPGHHAYRLHGDAGHGGGFAGNSAWRARSGGGCDDPARPPVRRGQATGPSPVRRVRTGPGYRPDACEDEGSRLARAASRLAPGPHGGGAYGRILPQTILDLAPLGCVNVHYSLLPKYRGAAPMQWAILGRGGGHRGDHHCSSWRRVDAGPVLLAEDVAWNRARRSLPWRRGSFPSARGS